MEQLYELDIHETLENSTNPYTVWIHLYFPDPKFEEYIRSLQENEILVIYETTEPILAFLGLPAFYIQIDRLGLIQKRMKAAFNPNNAHPLDLLIHNKYSFKTKRHRNRFIKQLRKQLHHFFIREIRLYQKIQKMIS